MFLGIFLTVFGLFLLIKPAIFWKITESWKSNDGTEPSDWYIWSTRLGGSVCSIVGLANIVVSFM